MSDQPVQEQPDIAKWIGLGFIAGIIVAALALEYYGYIQHPQADDSSVIEDFRLLSLNTDQEVKVSPKPSGKIAFCINGYLLLRPDNGKEVAGVLVDSKNRGVQCQVDINRPLLTHP